MRIKLTANRQTGANGVRPPTHWRSASVVVKVKDLLPRRSAAIIGAVTQLLLVRPAARKGRVRLRRPCHEEHEEKHRENCKRNEDVTDGLPPVTLGSVSEREWSLARGMRVVRFSLLNALRRCQRVCASGRYVRNPKTNRVHYLRPPKYCK